VSAAWSPDLSSCEKKTWNLNVEEDVRVVIRMYIDLDDHVVDFSLAHQVREDEWRTIYRSCTAHGSVHVHRHRRTGEKEVMQVGTITDVHSVNGAYERQWESLLEGWEANLRWWNGGG
jgi:hypothetical protein